MKTSFYFVLWIIIYPILGLINNRFIDSNAFIFALLSVWGIAYLLNRFMPDTLRYERASANMAILEDIYNENVPSFRKRISREAIVETVTSAYFCLALIVIVLAIFMAGVNDWLSLGIFGFFAFGVVSHCVELLKAKSKLKSNPTPGQCQEIAEELYKLDYASYYERHLGHEFEDIMPPRPRHFTAFQIVSIIVAVIALLLGFVYIFLGVSLMIGNTSLEMGAVAGMYFLYGSLAAYFGMKDVWSIAQSMRKKKNEPIS